MRKIRGFKILAILFVLIAVTQFLGLGEAFCHDEQEAGCTDCLTCPCHYFAELNLQISIPEQSQEVFAPAYRFTAPPQEPLFLFFRPPISA